jgi:hypothetical protein
MRDTGKQAPARFLDAAWRVAVSAGAGALRIPAWLGRHSRGIGNLALHLLALAITTYVFLALNRRYYYSGIGFDEAHFVWGGWSIKKGLAPYRDFLEFKPPMVFITHYFAQALFGFKDQGFRKFFTIFPLLSVLALQLSLVGRGIGRFFAAAVMVGAVALFVGGNWHDSSLSDCESIGLSYYMLGLACLLWEGRFVKLTTVLGGLFLACCVLSKEPFGLVVVFTWVTVFWLRGRGQPSRESSKLYAQYSLLGVWLLILALCVYMVPTGAMKGYLHLLLVDYRRIYSDPASSYCVLWGAGSTAATGGFIVDSWNRIRSAFLNESILGYLLPLLLPGAVFAFRRSKTLLALTALVFLGALAAPPMSRCMWHHYYIMTMAGVVFALVVAADSLKPALRAASRPLRGATTVALMLLVGLHVAPEIEKERKANYKREPWSEPQPGLVEFINANTTPSDRIFTTGAPILYPQTNRSSAARESCYVDAILGSYDGATDAEKLRPIYLQLVKNKPKVVFLDASLNDNRPRTNAALLKPFLAEFKYKKINDQLYLRP